MLEAGNSLTFISKTLRRCNKTIAKEVNRWGRAKYDPEKADLLAFQDNFNVTKSDVLFKIFVDMRERIESLETNITILNETIEELLNAKNH